MSGGRLSVVVVSRHRAGALARCVTALRQQIGASIELVIVADPGGIAAVAAADIRLATYDEANISQARNIGLSLATAPVVAFIDDDAVPEPTWAARLLAAIEVEPGIVAATGYVRGRNGISYQWRASEVDEYGRDYALDLPESGIFVPDPAPGRAIKTQGTNCAFRAEALRSIGGFDPALRFFLDETDVNLRLAPLGRTAISPAAQVHHAYLASSRRTSRRVPLSLFEIAASTAVFLRKHAPANLASGREELRREQLGRLQRLRRRLLIGRATEQSLMQTLEAGWQAGVGRPLGPLAPIPRSKEDFRPLKLACNGEGRVLSGWSWQMGALRAEALRARALGEIVSVLCLTPGLRRHWHGFDPAGFWIETGGLWGRTDRDKGPPIGQGRAACRSAFIDRVSRYRPVAPTSRI